MVDINFANFITVGILALVFFVAINMLAEKTGLKIPGL